jgi:hypothetical protein
LVDGSQGAGISSSITGSAVTRAAGGVVSPAANTGHGGAQVRPTFHAGASGVVIVRYPAARSLTIGAGLTGTTSTVGSNKVTTITAGTGNISFS